jgi:hypothetical protein
MMAGSGMAIEQLLARLSVPVVVEPREMWRAIGHFSIRESPCWLVVKASERRGHGSPTLERQQRIFCWLQSREVFTDE